jgi:mRNA interferase MazF
MTLLFYPRAGQVFVGDFSDLKEPEMTKIRPVIVVSPRLPHRSHLVAIVPVSLTAPKHNLPFCFKLSRNYHPNEVDTLDCWAKCDMVTNVSVGRLSAFKVGRRRYAYPELSPEDLLGVRMAVLAGLGLDKLIRND